MSNVINLENHPNYRRILNELENELIINRQAFISSLSISQYRLFMKLSREIGLNNNWLQTVNIEAVTKDPTKQNLFNKWKLSAYKVNLVNGTIKQDGMSEWRGYPRAV